MKIPKIKLSKRSKDRIVIYGAMTVYALGAALYGAFNYLDGSESSWNMLTSKTDEDGNTFWRNGDSDDKDAQYLMFGKKATSMARDALEKGKTVALAVMEDKEDKEDNDGQEDG